MLLNIRTIYLHEVTCISLTNNPAAGVTNHVSKIPGGQRISFLDTKYYKDDVLSRYPHANVIKFTHEYEISRYHWLNKIAVHGLNVPRTANVFTGT